MSEVLEHSEMVSGGDLRGSGNQWLRAAYVASGLSKVPREGQIRLAVARVAKKKKLCRSNHSSSSSVCTVFFGVSFQT